MNHSKIERDGIPNRSRFLHWPGAMEAVSGLCDLGRFEVRPPKSVDDSAAFFESEIFNKSDRSRYSMVTFVTRPTKSRQHATIADTFYTLRALKHPNLVKYIGFSFLDPYGHYKASFISEKIEGAHVRELLRSVPDHDKSPVSKEAKMYVLLVANALCYLHSKGIVAGNLCNETIVVDSGNRVLLTNYGLMPTCLELHKKSWYIDPWYCAPELLQERRRRPAPSSDVWSFGVFLFEVFAKKQMKTVIGKEIEKRNLGQIPAEIAQIAKKCWEKNPEDRPQMFHVLQELKGTSVFQDVPDVSNDRTLLETRVAAGDPVAMNELADALSEGKNGFERDLSRAFELYRAAAEKRLPQAMSNYGVSLQEGDGGEPNLAEGVEWITKAAHAGNLDGIAQLGMCYVNGHGVKKSMKKGMALLEQAATGGNTFAQVNYGIFLQEQKPVEGARWIEKAADQGDPEGMYNLALCFSAGDGVERNETKAAELMHRAALADHALAQFEFAKMLRDGKGVAANTQGAMAFMLLAVMNGVEEASEAYRQMNPSPPPPPNPADVLSEIRMIQKEIVNIYTSQFADFDYMFRTLQVWMRRKGRKRRHSKRARQPDETQSTCKDEDSQSSGGESDDVEEVPQSPVIKLSPKRKSPKEKSPAQPEKPLTKEQERTRHLKEKALQGSRNDAYYYGMRCIEGRGMPVDLEAGQKWLKRCSKTGHSTASLRLAHFFKEGAFGFADEARAREYLHIASTQKNREAMIEWSLMEAMKNKNIHITVFPQADEIDDPEVLFEIGYHFLNSQDLKRAEPFLSKAAKLGYEAAADLLSENSRRGRKSSE